MRNYGMAALAAVGFIFIASAAPALTADELKCQSTAAKAGRVYLKKVYKALEKCEDAINQGKFATSTDCALETKTALKLSKAEDGLRGKVTGACANPIVAALDWGGQCFGVTTATTLGDCLIDQHRAAADRLIVTAYDDDKRICAGGANVGLTCTTNANCPTSTCILGRTPGVCAGGTNDGNACIETADCPMGVCALSDAAQDCTKDLGKVIGKFASKRQSILQKCKKSVGKGTLPASTDCIADGQVKLDDELAKALAAIAAACPDVVSTTLKLGAACDQQTLDSDGIAACGTCSVARATDDLILAQHGSHSRGANAAAAQITNAVDCVGGPLSRCRVNDYLLANDRIRVVVQDVQRNLFGIGQFGGQIIDGDLVRVGLDPDRDNFEEWAISLNIESTAHYTALTVLNDGSNGGPAILRATGVDDLLDFINPSSVVAGFGFPLPPSANDTDIPVTITTDYILEPGTNYVRVETTVQNTSGAALPIFFGEYIGGSGQIELFQPGYGFGEPLVAASCSKAKPNRCNFTAYSGEDDADGVSYGFIHQIPGSSTFTTSGVHVPQLGVEVLFALIGAASPPFTLAATGNPGDAQTFTRYFVVGDGSVSSIVDARNEIDCVPTGTLSGVVTAGASPAAGADIAVFGNLADGPGIAALTRNVVTHTRAAADGSYALTLPPGSYNVVANLDGSPYEGGGSSPVQHAIVVTAFDTLIQNVALPATGALQVTVDDENNAASAAKVTVVGFDPSPDLVNAQSLFGLVNNRTYAFGDRGEDGQPYGLSTTFNVGPSGSSPIVPLEPGSYQVTVSRGPEYSIDSTPVAVVANMTQNVTAKVERVIDSSGFVSSDFHVHSINSPDAEVSHSERVLTMLGEGVDFFASTDHDIRVDFQPAINALAAAGLVGTAPGQETTTFDYGHFNAWPLVIDPAQVNGGAVDHGGAAPAGLDYPSAGNFNEIPEDVIALAHADAPGAENTVQVNHVHSFFGAQGGSGLAIDTGVVPPQSAVTGAARRLNPAVTNYFTDDMDALEIWIGDDRGQIFGNFLGENAGSWFNLLNQGIITTGIADSDTHSRWTTQAGVPRSMVASPNDNPGALSALADTLSVNVNDGRVVGTNGPMVRVQAFAASTAQTGSLELGFPTTIATTDGEVDITVDIQSPTWVEFDKVEYYINSTTTRTTIAGVQTGAGTVSVKKYSITPDVVQTAPGDFVVNTVPVAGTFSSRFEATTTLNLTGLTEDFWVVVMVKGTDGVSRPLFPVQPNSIKQSTNTSLAQLTDGNLGEDGMPALAFTNPLFVDVDGGGWTSPGLQINP